jgi:FtsZ-binding cell division protein ZapB
MTDHADPFTKLEEKIARTVEAFRRVQAEKTALEEQLESLKSASRDQGRRWEAQERELVALRKEREEVRSRVEKLLEQIDGLTKPDSAG